MYTGQFTTDPWETHYPELWDGCVGAWAPLLGPTGTTVYDWSRSNNGTLTNASVASAWESTGGNSALLLDGTNDYVDLGSPASLNLPGTLSFSCWYRSTSAKSSQAFIANSNGGGSFANYAVTFNYTSNKFELWNNASGPQITSAATISDTAWHHFACVRYGTAGSWNLALYIDGTLDKTGTSGIDPSGGSYAVSLGRFGGFNGYYVLGNLDDMRLYNRVLTPSEIRLLSTRRGVAYEVADSFPYGVTAGAAAYTLTASAGSFSLSGSSASLIASRQITASPGSLTLTGNTASLIASRKISPQAGSFTVTGNSASLLASRILSPSSGAITLNGNSASLIASRKLSPATGAFVLTGHSITFRKTSVSGGSRLLLLRRRNALP